MHYELDDFHYELGGFAEEETDIDGDFESFNYCLAEEYKDAIIDEDFKAIGKIRNDLLDNIIYWLNKNDNYYEVAKSIDNGSIITKNNRTFIEAIINCHQYQIAETYIDRGIINVKLYLTCMLYGDDVTAETILNRIHYFIDDREEYIEFLNSIFNEIEIEYNVLDANEKIEFLNKIKRSISKIKYPTNYEKISVSISHYNWGKQYKIIK